MLSQGSVGQFLHTPDTGQDTKEDPSHHVPDTQIRWPCSGFFYLYGESFAMWNRAANLTEHTFQHDTSSDIRQMIEAKATPLII